MTAVKTFYKFLKVIALIYGIGVAGVSTMIGVDASQITFPPTNLPLSQFRSTNPDGSIEMMMFMGYGGFLYNFIVPTVIVIHNGTFGKDVALTTPNPLGLFGINLKFPVPLMFSPGSFMAFNVTIPNFTSPIFQFVVMPQAWLGGFKIMEFQINTYTFPVIPYYNQTISL